MRISRWLSWMLWPAIAAAGGQQGGVAPDASVAAALANLSRRAEMVFVGQVVDIRRNAGVVEIQFRVDKPVVGETGGSYTLREWAGMWPPGQSRYRAGERVLVFLHGTSGAGLSSAVDGREGVVPLMADTDGTVLLDVRRLSTRVERQPGEPLADATNGAITLKDALPMIQSRGTTGVRPVRRPLPRGAGIAPGAGAMVPIELPQKPQGIEQLPAPAEQIDQR